MNESMKLLLVMMMEIIAIILLKPLGGFIFLAGILVGLLLENK